ncbi:hypothetical protein B0H17DRAFT_1150892 [Mycena rosella]|uniref:Uncharacterized protein n=1 Tax=Mycena rosella TaxID=1033263 RepID=A0AAD7BP31_MYCRO|nr:hypothetical protein B0H17DRAFT_1150892 [Mycena rosella]
MDIDARRRDGWGQTRTWSKGRLNAVKKPRQPRTPRIFLPIVTAPLPSPPAAPPFPPPSITEGDLETYVKPLILNGWAISPIAADTVDPSSPLKGQPPLNHIYNSHDYSSARDFFRYRPDPRTTTQRCRRAPNEAESGFQYSVTAPDQQAASTPRKYGISHADVRFAIEAEASPVVTAPSQRLTSGFAEEFLRNVKGTWKKAEAEFMKNWAGKGDNTGFPRTAPTTMEQSLPFSRRLLLSSHCKTHFDRLRVFSRRETVGVPRNLTHFLRLQPVRPALVPPTLHNLRAMSNNVHVSARCAPSGPAVRRLPGAGPPAPRSGYAFASLSRDPCQTILTLRNWPADVAA